MKTDKLLLLGAGGHCRSVLSSLDRENFAVVAAVDVAKVVGQDVSGIPVIGTDGDLPDFYAQGYNKVFIALGNVGNAGKISSLYNKLKEIGFSFIKVIDPTAIIADDVVIGEGTFVGKGAVINTGVEIGDCCIINSGAVIDHDSKIGSFSHIAPGVSISGQVDIGKGVLVGVGSSVIQCIKIGSNTLVGAGSVVVTDIVANVKAFGNPCKMQ